MWVGIWVCGCIEWKALIRMTWNLAWVQKVKGQGHTVIIPIWRFWDPLNIFAMVKSRHFVFGTHTEHTIVWQNTPKVGILLWFGSHDLNFKIWDPLYNFWTDAAMHTKFCTLLDCVYRCLQMKNLPVRGGLGHWDPFWN